MCHSKWPKLFRRDGPKLWGNACPSVTRRGDLLQDVAVRRACKEPPISMERLDATHGEGEDITMWFARGQRPAGGEGARSSEQRGRVLGKERALEWGEAGWEPVPPACLPPYPKGQEKEGFQGPSS